MATHYIAPVHFSGGTGHQHVSQVVWTNGSTFKGGVNSTSDMVQFIDKGGDVRVSDGSTTVAVGVVRPDRGQPYLRTFKDKTWTDNLLSVPRY